MTYDTKSKPVNRIWGGCTFEFTVHISKTHNKHTPLGCKKLVETYGTIITTMSDNQKK